MSCPHLNFPPILLVFAVILIPGPLKAKGFETVQPPLIEITKVDLFSLKDWNSTQVSILGFKLGMERNDVLKNAQRQGLTVDDEFGQGCLNADTCSAFRASRYIGLAVTFGFRNSIQRIRVELPWDLSHEEREALLVNEFSGQTKEFFTHYSDDLRIRLLGPASVFGFGGTSWGGPPLNQEYQYYSKGLILRIRLKNPKSNNRALMPKISGDFTFPR